MNNILVENKYGHGALPLILDIRDHKWSSLGKSSQPFDWSIGFEAETSITKTKNQGTSGSCGGQAGSYLDSLITKSNERSAKNVYSQIFYKAGGTTLRDILNLLVNKGACAEAVISSYKDGLPPDEPFMEDTTANINAETNASFYKVSGYGFINPDIESYAQAIRDNGGAIMQLNGQNNGTWDSLEPIGPNNKLNLWSHFLICTGVLMRNGKKCIKIHNSWGVAVGEQGYQYINEDYFNTGNVLQGGFIYQTTNPIINTPLQVKYNLIKQILDLIQLWITAIKGKSKNAII